MPSTGTRKKNNTAGRKTTRKKNPSVKKRQRQAYNRELVTEITILIALAVSVLLVISNFDIGGKVGTVISQFFFGLFGWMAYPFPVILFLGTAFAIANSDSDLMPRKLWGVGFAFWCLTTLIHLFSMGYLKGDTISGYYTYCSQHKTGGGIIGGATAKFLCISFGTAGAYVLMFILLIISVIIITQHTVLAPLKKTGEKVYQEARENHARRVEERGVFALEETKLPREKEIKEAKENEKAAAKESAKEEKRRQREERRLAREAAKAQTGESRQNDERDSDSEAPDVSSSFLPQLHIERPEPAPVPEESAYAMQQDLPFDVQELKPVTNEEMQADPEVSEQSEEVPAAHAEKTTRTRKSRSSQEEIANGIENIQQEIAKEPVKKEYIFPPLDFLKRGDRKVSGDSDAHLRETAMKLQTTLHNFGVNVTITNVSCGPTVTRYELQPEQGVKVSKIVGLTDDIKLNLAAADIRIEAPIPGKAAVGIEVPNATNSPVMLRDLLETKEFREFPSELAFAVGKDIGGKTVVADIGKMPHLLIAGATGSGKSVCINTLIMSIIYKAKPEEVKLIMIDPKVVELSVYNGIPHLFIPVVTDPKKAAGALNWAVAEMTDRYNKFAEYNVRDLRGYNAKVAQLDDIEDENKPQKLPKIVIIVDELADLMMVAPGEVEDAICRLAQLARAAGIHLIIATQRPSVNVITGLIKANMPSRIAFSVSSGVDSRTILDMNGAEKLLGKGDMLYYPQGYQKPVRLQGAFVSDKEVGKVVEFLTDNHQTDQVYDSKITDMMNASQSSAPGGGSGRDLDAYFVDAGKFIIDKNKASIGMLQRMFKVGFNRAARIMDQLCEAGVVGPEEGTKPRKVLMSMEEFENYIEECL